MLTDPAIAGTPAVNEGVGVRPSTLSGRARVLIYSVPTKIPIIPYENPDPGPVSPVIRYRRLFTPSVFMRQKLVVQ